MAAILLIGLTGALVLAMLAWQWYDQTLREPAATSITPPLLVEPRQAILGSATPQRLSPFRARRPRRRPPHRAA